MHSRKHRQFPPTERAEMDARVLRGRRGATILTGGCVQVVGQVEGTTPEGIRQTEARVPRTLAAVPVSDVSPAG